MSIIDYFRKEDINAGIMEYRKTKGAMLVDVRTAVEYRSGHIPSAHNFPVENIKDITRLIPKEDTRVFLYCQSGRRAVRARDKIAIFKKLGIWIEDGTITPKPGYIIVYNWNTRTQPNDGFADHIGVVDSVKDGIITCIEGNKGEAVGYRSIPVGWGYIRGYAAPKYDKEEETAQAEVPAASAPAHEKKSGGISKEPSWKGRVTASALNVRTWAGIRYPRIKTYPTIPRGTAVEVCDSVKASDGSTWYYIRIVGRIYGFVHSDYISKV